MFCQSDDFIKLLIYSLVIYKLLLLCKNIFEICSIVIKV